MKRKHTCEGFDLELNGCHVPEDLYYNLDEHSWFRFNSDDTMTIGVVSIFHFYSGKITKITFKDHDRIIKKGKSVAFLESPKYVGRITVPCQVEVVAHNLELTRNPSLLHKSPYDQGWISRVRPIDASLEELAGMLTSGSQAAKHYAELISKKWITCFKEVPDMVWAALGIDCNTVLMALTDRIKDVQVGQVMHIIGESKDENVERDILTWGEQTGHEIIDIRKEKPPIYIVHFLVRRTH